MLRFAISLLSTTQPERLPLEGKVPSVSEADEVVDASGGALQLVQLRASLKL